MTDDSLSEIARLRKQLYDAEQAHLNWNILLPERESLDRSIQEMIVQIEEATKAWRQKKAHNPELAQNLSKEIELHQQFLVKAKKKKQELDHLLDILEDSTEEKIDIIRRQLVDAILKADPQQQSIYEHLEAERSQLATLFAQLSSISEVCIHLAEILAIIHDTRQKVRRQWIFGYLFGKNPHVVIAQQLHAAELLCETALTTLEQQKEIPLHELHRDLKGFLKELHKHCKQRWGFKTLDTTFSKALHTLIGLNQTIAHHIGHITKAQQNADQKFASWLGVE